MSSLPTPENIITSHVEKGSTVILAISGGVDSIYLLHLCQKLKKKLSVNLIIAHVDHNYRKSSKSDAIFVKQIADKLNLPFELSTLKKINTGNLEDKFREARYKFFETVRKNYKADWIILGHHLNDNIETILLNLIRGTTIDGMGGMEPIDVKRHLLRPLIYTPKQQIIQSAKKLKLKNVEDKTNFDPKFSRNRVRLKVVPELKKINPSLEKTFQENILKFQQTKKSINFYIDNWLNQNLRNQKIELKKFLELPYYFQTTVLAQIYKKLYKSTNKFNTKHLNQIMQIIHKQYSNRKKEFGDHYFISIERDQNNKIKYICFQAHLEKKR